MPLETTGGLDDPTLAAAVAADMPPCAGPARQQAQTSLVPSEAVSSGLQDEHHGQTVQEGHHVGLTYAAALALTSSATQEAAGLALNSTPNAASTPEAQLA